MHDRDRTPPGLDKKGGVPPGLARKDKVPPGHDPEHPPYDDDDAADDVAEDEDELPVPPGGPDPRAGV